MYSYIFKHSEPMNAKRMKDKEEMLCEYFHQWINAFMPFALCAVTNQQTMFTYRAHTSCFNFYVSSHRVKRCSLFAFIFLLLLLTCFLSLSFFFLVRNRSHYKQSLECAINDFSHFTRKKNIYNLSSSFKQGIIANSFSSRLFSSVYHVLKLCDWLRVNLLSSTVNGILLQCKALIRHDMTVFSPHHNKHTHTHSFALFSITVWFHFALMRSKHTFSKMAP